MAYLLSHRIDVILGCLAIAATVPARAQHPEPGPYRIAAVRAFLYFNQKDSLSANIADTSADALFNTPMGGTFDPNPSEEVLIKVEIMGGAQKVRVRSQDPSDGQEDGRHRARRSQAANRSV